MQIRDKVDEFSQILGKNMETIQQYYAICSLTIKRLPLVAPYLETVARETVLENIPLFARLAKLLYEKTSSEYDQFVDACQKYAECTGVDKKIFDMPDDDLVRVIGYVNVNSDECYKYFNEYHEVVEDLKGIRDSEHKFRKLKEVIDDYSKTDPFYREFGLKMDTILSIAITKLSLLMHPNVYSYNEPNKQTIFNADPAKSVAILLYEYANGVGETIRVFGVGKPNSTSFGRTYIKGFVVKDLMSDFSDNVLKKYTYKEFYDKTVGDYKKYMNNPMSYFGDGDNSGIKFSLEFSPDQTPTLRESVYKHVASNEPQIFIGGASGHFYAMENDESHVYVIIGNCTSRNSLEAHVADNYERIAPPYPIMSSIYQMIVFKLKINKDDFKK